MRSGSCPYEEAVAAAAKSGDWSPELRAHRDGCLTCAELTLVVGALAADARELTASNAPLPDPGLMWLRSRLVSRERDYRRATRAITWVQRATIAVVAAVVLAFAPGLWRLAARSIANLGLHAPALDLPRAAGSPLLVLAASVVVLGLLAVFELTAIQER
jgi:hypothetical protein